MFIDIAKIKVSGGHGGKGCVSFLREKYKPFGGPDGGPGGNGGSVIIKADKNIATLADYFYQPICHADKGVNGGSNNKFGANGSDKILPVPVGTVVKDKFTQKIIADLDEAEKEVVVAKGGRGGKGNSYFKSSTNRTPRFAQPGEEGEEKELELELKILADIGLVGFPNAGKSTLISGITHAHSKIASYPFTTRQPILGLLEFPDFSTAVIADIPGLLEGAHKNVGLGHKFLRHVERCSILVVLLDMAGVDNRKPWDDYKILLNELSCYNEELGARTKIVVANKMDLPAAEENYIKFKEKYSELEVLQISALEGIGFEMLFEEFQKSLKHVVNSASAAKT